MRWTAITMAVPAAVAVVATAAAPRPLGERGARTRQRLLDAAERIFTEVGYPEASVSRIAGAAGVAPGTFYLYFSSKLAVFEQVVEDLNRRVRAAMAEASSRGRTRAEAEELGFRAFFHFSAGHPGLYRVIRQAEFVSPRSLRLHYGRIVDGYVVALREAIAAGEVVQGNPEVMAWALMGVGEMVGLRWILWEDGPREISDEVFAEVIALVRRALGIAAQVSTALS